MNMNRLHRWYCRSDRWRRIVGERLLPWALAGVHLGDDVVELGAGPGLTTDLLAKKVARLTAVELDPRLAAALRDRSRGTNVRVIEADATALPLAEAVATSVVCFTMLHHVPSPRLQDALFAEAARVLLPGGTFAGSDSTTSLLFRLVHVGDTLVPVLPETLAQRLERAGFVNIKVSLGAGAFRFRAKKPSLPSSAG